MTENQTNENPYVHKFSWIDQPVDVREHCSICLTYRNSPCQPFNDLFGDIADRKDRLSVEDTRRPAFDDLSTDVFMRLMACTQLNRDVYEPRIKEKEAFMKQLKAQQQQQRKKGDTSSL